MKKKDVEQTHGSVSTQEPHDPAAETHGSVSTQEPHGPEETHDRVSIQEDDTTLQLLEEIQDLKDKNLRLMAEFDNFRKRSAKEKSDLRTYGGEDIMKKTLPLIDDFERALEAMKTAVDVDAVKEGVELIYAKFLAFLADNGVQAIATENEVFDTDLHEAITTFPAPTKDQKGKIIDCTAKGYTLNDKVIRYAKVVVGE